MIRFYFSKAINQIRRETRRTVFVLFCIAAGVAAVTSLRNLGLMVETTLTKNLRTLNRGDLVIRLDTRGLEAGRIIHPDGREIRVDSSLYNLSSQELDTNYTFSRSAESRLRAWASNQSFSITPIFTNGGPFMRVYEVAHPTVATFVMVRCVEPDLYPFYGEMVLSEPKDLRFSEALDRVDHIVVSQLLAEDTGWQVGDQVNLTGHPYPFTIAGILDNKGEPPSADPLTSIFPLIYLPYTTGVGSVHNGPTHFYVRFDQDVQDSDLLAAQLMERYPGLEVSTIEDTRRSNLVFSSRIQQIATVMGLLSLLIGGLGIANTMAVVISRRKLEIAVLKTVGARGSHIFQMLATEMVILGIAGSLLGIVLGLVWLGFLKIIAENFLNQSMPFIIFPEPVFTGFTLGLLATLVFSLIPVLTALRIRPNLVLHPQNGGILRQGKITNMLFLVLLTTVIGSVLGWMIDTPGTGLGVAYGILILSFSLFLVLRLFLRMLAKIPTFGIFSLRIAQRELDHQNVRAGSTALSLLVGIFTLATLLILTQGIIVQANRTTEEILGGNVLVTVKTLNAGDRLVREIHRIPGVDFLRDEIYQAEIIAINGDRDIDRLIQHARENARASEKITGSALDEIDDLIHRFTIKTRTEDTWEYDIATGEDLSEQTPTGEILLEPLMYSRLHEWVGFQVGDKLTLRFTNGAIRTATIRGFTAPQNSGILNLGNFRSSHAISSPQFIPRKENPLPGYFILQIPPDQISPVLTHLSKLEGVFMVTTDQFAAYAEGLIDRFSSLPLVVAGISLFASGTIIANSVTLATLERRRSLGILKALGLQSRQVLGLLLIENVLVGTLGSVFGIVLSTAIIQGGGFLGEGNNLPIPQMIGLILLPLILTVIITVLAAYRATQEKPIEVLRYE